VGCFLAPLLVDLVATLGNANKLFSAVAEEWQLLYLWTQLNLISFSFLLISTFTPVIHGAAIPSSALCTQQRVL